jgi:hypothetical protein
LLEETFLGTIPEPVPLIAAVKTNSSTHNGVLRQWWELTFDVAKGGVSKSITLPLEVFSPISEGPHPIFMTQWNHREWALNGATRGYLSVIYPGADAKDVTPQFQKAFPNNSFALIMARAYVGARCLDFLLSSNSGLPAVNPKQVAVSGHSRNGKQSLIFAAYDTRITAVVGSSPGAPIASPFHFTSSNFMGEGPRTGGVVGPGTSGWWIPSVLQYDGHPERMPMDGHGVVGLIAPRACAIATGHQDPASDMIFADEMNLKAAGLAYELLGARDQLRNIYRYGGHHGFDDVTTYFDWFDHAFNRRTAFALELQQEGSLTADSLLQWPMTWLTPAGFDWPMWNKTTFGQYKKQPVGTAPLHARINWLLALEGDGEATGVESTASGATDELDEVSAFSVGATYGEETEAKGGYITDLFGHSPDGTPLAFQAFSFGDYLSATAFWPEKMPVDKTKPQPAVIWLHQYSYNTGYSSSMFLLRAATIIFSHTIHRPYAMRAVVTNTSRVARVWCISAYSVCIYSVYSVYSVYSAYSVYIVCSVYGVVYY